MVNWVGKVFGLPNEFLFNGDSETSIGGGSMQNAASDAILLAFLAARHKRITEACGDININCRDKEHTVLNKLVAYSSAEAHSCVEKAALIALVHMRPVKADEKFQMRGKDLERQVQKDIEKGNVPFFVLVTLGTTGTGAYDQLKEIIPVAKKYNLWVHIDASYGGSAWCCEEFRYQMEGIKDVDSININLHKIFLHTSSATFFWQV
uniref:Dopa decarboxylase n=1 Tax=Panagrolaimus sp. ES5 TaxID=591445 RepID=A0AC34GID7_9BILA